MTDEVRKIMVEKGCSARQAYRIINKRRPVKDKDFERILKETEEN